jgi:hypothetical protein
MHGLTGGDWKRAVTCGTAPVPDPTQSVFDLLVSVVQALAQRSRLSIMRL